MTPITLDSNLSKKLDQGMRSGDTAELPFPAVFIWALNGQAATNHKREHYITEAGPASQMISKSPQTNRAWRFP